MTKVIQGIFVSVWFNFLICSVASAQGSEVVLEIRISKILKAKGKLVVGVYQDESTWLKKPYLQRVVSTDNEQTVLSFSLPAGTYAISMYQDINSNGELDRNFLGIPKEPVGFGNNYRPFGPPKYEAAAVDVAADNRVQNIELFEAL